MVRCLCVYRLAAGPVRTSEHAIRAQAPATSGRGQLAMAGWDLTLLQRQDTGAYSRAPTHGGSTAPAAHPTHPQGRSMQVRPIQASPSSCASHPQSCTAKGQSL